MNDIKTDVYTSDAYLTELFWKRSDNAVKMADKKYHNLIFSVIIAILGNREDSEECVNDVYIKLWDIQIRSNIITVLTDISLRAIILKMSIEKRLKRRHLKRRLAFFRCHSAFFIFFEFFSEYLKNFKKKTGIII